MRIGASRFEKQRKYQGVVVSSVKDSFLKIAFVFVGIFFHHISNITFSGFILLILSFSVLCLLLDLWLATDILVKAKMDIDIRIACISSTFKMIYLGKKVMYNLLIC
jgi:hypothetical protein